MLVASLVVVLAGRTARADNLEAPPDAVTPAYLTDGGAMWFFWVPIMGTIVVDRYITMIPEPTPVLDPISERGNEAAVAPPADGPMFTFGGSF